LNRCVQLPQLPPLQFLILAFLVRQDELSGRDMRELLAQSGAKSTAPAYYQLMARMEDAGFVEGWYSQKQIEHQVVNERRYRITASGRDAWKSTGDFYGFHSRLLPADAPRARKAAEDRPRRLRREAAGAGARD